MYIVQHCNTVLFKTILLNVEISLYNKVPDQIKLWKNFNVLKRT
jgi:hypothetical protein